MGKNPILLETCSILMVYKGVLIEELAVTATAANNTIATLDATSNIFDFIFTSPFTVDVLQRSLPQTFK